MTNEDEIIPVEVFSGHIWDAELVKSVLEDAGIDAYLFDENIGTIAPWYAAGGGAGAVRVMVSSRDASKAMTLLTPGIQAGDGEEEK